MARLAKKDYRIIIHYFQIYVKDMKSLLTHKAYFVPANQLYYLFS